MRTGPKLIPRPPVRSSIRRAFSATLLGAALLGASAAHASLTVLVGEPFGNFGTMMPTGHTSVYLDRVCADGPFKLRLCTPGEPQGVVVARYAYIGAYDWIASPVLQFFYAVDHADEVPAYVTESSVWELRQRYRRRFLAGLVPDGHERDAATGEWWETAGMAYNRRFWGYGIPTTLQQDEQFIAAMNADENLHRYALGGANCANFAAAVVNFYFPGAVPRGDRIADFGLTTPKHVARSVATWSKAHPEFELTILEVPQVPGTLRRSRPARGISEGVLKTKRYLATLLVLQPEIPLGLAFLYLDHGRWPLGRDATRQTPQMLEQIAPGGNGGVVAVR